MPSRRKMTRVFGNLQQNPCIRLARLKFELTNQDSAGGKNFTVLKSRQVTVQRTQPGPPSVFQ